MKKLKEFGFGKARSMEATVQEEVTSLLDDMETKSAATGSVWQVDPHRLSVLAINILWSSVGGYRFDPESPNIKRHLEMNTEIFEILRPTNPLTVFTFLKIFPKMSGYERHGQIHKRSREFMKVCLY
jgi:hypothetical protein